MSEAELPQNPLKEHLWPTMENLERRSTGGALSAVPTGIEDLTYLTTGWKAGELVIVSGAPSIGKSALLHSFLLHAALTSRVPSALFSLEMNEEACIGRWLCAESRIDTLRYAHGELHDWDFARVAQAAGLLNSAPIHLRHRPILYIDELCREVREQSKLLSFGLVLVDSLNLIRVAGFAPPATNREQEVGIIVRELKSLALDLGISILATANVSRASEQRPDKRPRLSDLRDSGEIENVADVVVLIYRPDFYFGPVDRDGNDIEGMAELIVAKNRTGPTGTVRAEFVREIVRFQPPRAVSEPIVE